MLCPDDVGQRALWAGDGPVDVVARADPHFASEAQPPFVEKRDPLPQSDGELLILPRSLRLCFPDCFAGFLGVAVERGAFFRWRDLRDGSC